MIHSFDSNSYRASGQLDKTFIYAFQQMVLDYYQSNGRTFLWRQAPYDPYHIVVSEIMLQQTQTYRVVTKFAQFIETFPDFNTLAHASLHDVLSAWQGLGYNRRGQALYHCAQLVMGKYNGILPTSPTIIETFPGIGKTTASSVCAFAFNMPTLFIETNIRAVYIQTFFPQEIDVKDQTLMPLVDQTLYKTDPRTWYYALMDYGVMLKKKFNNPSKRSAHHAQQSAFEGSERQIRGMIVKLLTQHKALNFLTLCELIPREQERIARNLEKLCQEGLVSEKHTIYILG